MLWVFSHIIALNMLFRYMTDIKVPKVPIWQITQFFILLMDVLSWSISPKWRLLVEANCQFRTEEGVDGVIGRCFITTPEFRIGSSPLLLFIVADPCDETSHITRDSLLCYEVTR